MALCFAGTPIYNRCMIFGEVKKLIKLSLNIYYRFGTSEDFFCSFVKIIFSRIKTVNTAKIYYEH